MVRFILISGSTESIDSLCCYRSLRNPCNTEKAELTSILILAQVTFTLYYYGS